MRAFLAIIKLELISALRSKTMFMFALGCSLWMIFGHNILKGESQGMYMLSVRYLLGVVFCVVLVSVGAAAAGALSSDRAAKRLQLSMIRPVPHSVIAAARIIALTFIGSAVIAMALAFLWMYEGKGRTCDEVYAPKMEDVKEAAERKYRELLAKDKTFQKKVEEVGERDILNFLEVAIRDTYDTVPPGGSISWDFSGVPDNVGEASVRVRFVDFLGRSGSIVGEFTFDGMSAKVNNPVKTRFLVPFSSSTGSSGKSKELRFTNHTNVSLSLQPRKDLHILVKSDSFVWNALRAWFVMSFVLMIAVSIGVFFGSCLGRGVAIFTLMSLLVVMAISPSTMESYPDPSKSSTITRMGLRLTEFSNILISPMNNFSPVSLLESDERVCWKEVGKAAATGMFYMALFSFLSGMVMSRKQD